MDGVVYGLGCEPELLDEFDSNFTIFVDCGELLEPDGSLGGVLGAGDFARRPHYILSPKLAGLDRAPLEEAFRLDASADCRVLVEL